MLKSKKLILIVILCMSFIVVLSGCSKDTETTEPTADTTETSGAKEAVSDEKVEISYTNFSASGDNQQYLDAMITEFNKEYPNIEVDVQTMPYDGYFDQMMAKTAAGEAPDLYELNYENFVSFASKGVIKDISGLISSNGFDTSKYNVNALEAFQVDAKQYGLPNDFSNVVLFYNKDLFDQAGVAYPSSDWTWQDVIDASVKIRALDENIYGSYRPITFNEFYKVTAQNGGNIISEDGTTFNVNSKEAVEAVEYMTDMVTKYNVQPTQTQMAGMGDWDLFKSGRLGMIVTGIWAFPDFERDCQFNWDIAVEPGNVNKATNFFSNAIVMNEDCENEDAAFKFMTFMTSDDSVAQIRVDNGFALPPVASDTVINSYVTQTPPENREAVYESLDSIVMVPVVEQMAKMQDIVNVHLNTVVDGTATPQEAMDACQKELTEQIDLQ